MLFNKGCYDGTFFGPYLHYKVSIVLGSTQSLFFFFPGGLDVVGKMKIHGVPFNKDTFTLAIATCYKLVRACYIKACQRTLVLKEIIC